MKLTVLDVLCSFLQIASLVMIVMAKQLPTFIPVLIGIAGFAAVVKFFLPCENPFDRILRPIAAVAGLGIIVIGCKM